MRIVHVVSRSQRRGAERVALDLAEELDALGHENRVIALVLGLDGVEDPALPALVRSASLGPHMRALSAWKLGRLLEREDPDVVLAHGGCPALVTVAGFPRHRPGIVWQQILGFPDKIHRQPRLGLWKAVAHRVDGAVALTQDEADELREIGLSGPISVIPNFRRSQRFLEVDRHDARARLHAQLGIPASTLTIGFVGYLVHQKRPERAVEVLQRVRALGVDAHLVVAGDGPMRKSLEHEIATRGLDAHVSLLGHRNDVEHIFGSVDLAVLTSEDEGIPGVAIEAAMTGCPFVTFALGGVHEVVLDGITGTVVTNQDTEVMAERVADLLRDNETRLRLGTEARARSHEFAAPERAKTYAEFLARFARSSRRETEKPGPTRASGSGR